jgi:hypothetical protein
VWSRGGGGTGDRQWPGVAEAGAGRGTGHHMVGGGGSACGWRGPGAMGLARKEKYPFAIHSNKIQWI